jgi:hypothetical protein
LAEEDQVEVSKLGAVFKSTNVHTYVTGKCYIQRVSFPSDAKSRVARWFVFIPGISIWGNCWRVLHTMEEVGIFYGLGSILRPFGIFCDQLVYFMDIWYIYTVLVCCTKNNLATQTA